MAGTTLQLFFMLAYLSFSIWSVRFRRPRVRFPSFPWQCPSLAVLLPTVCSQHACSELGRWEALLWKVPSPVHAFGWRWGFPTKQLREQTSCKCCFVLGTVVMLTAHEENCNCWVDAAWSFHVLKASFFQCMLGSGRITFAMALHYLWTTSKWEMSPDECPWICV